jgi:uncharacterized protein (DUF2141 family)
MKFAYLLVAPVLALTASAQRNYAIQGCLGLTTAVDTIVNLGGTVLTTLFTSESQCAVSQTF